MHLRVDAVTSKSRPCPFYLRTKQGLQVIDLLIRVGTGSAIGIEIIRQRALLPRHPPPRLPPRPTERPLLTGRRAPHGSTLVRARRAPRRRASQRLVDLMGRASSLVRQFELSGAFDASSRWPRGSGPVNRSPRNPSLQGWPSTFPSNRDPIDRPPGRARGPRRQARDLPHTLPFALSRTTPASARSRNSLVTRTSPLTRSTPTFSGPAPRSPQPGGLLGLGTTESYPPGLLDLAPKTV